MGRRAYCVGDDNVARSNCGKSGDACRQILSGLNDISILLRVGEAMGGPLFLGKRDIVAAGTD